MSKLRQGLGTSEGLEHLEPLLKSWQYVIKRYCAIWENGDNPWWYTERATLSTLAAAAWRIRWTALEEFNTSKRPRPSSKKTAPSEKGKDGKGRCDLFVTSQNEHEEFAIEAKQAWQSIGSKSSGTKTILRMADAAWIDVGHLNLGEAKMRLALTFVVPFIPARYVASLGIDPMIDKWLERQPFRTHRSRAPTYAYVFPRRNTDKEFVNEKGDAYPGVGLIIEHRRRAVNRQ